MLKYQSTLIIVLMLVAACSPGRKVLSDTDKIRSKVSASEAIGRIPDYETDLNSISGKGRALVSEQGKSDRFTLDFNSNRELSLITVKNRIGITGGEFLVDKDSILIYNKIDKIAQKVSVFNGNMTSLNELASINVISMLNFTVSEGEIDQVLEDDKSLYLILFDKTEVVVSKKSGLIESVEKPYTLGAPYSRIVYEGYGNIKGFTLPRKISIFSRDGSSKVAFLVRSLNLNPEKINLSLKIPDGISIQRL